MTHSPWGRSTTCTGSSPTRASARAPRSPSCAERPGRIFPSSPGRRRGRRPRRPGGRASEPRMARVSERLPDNADGEFYVDRSCIDCDTCTRVAPGLFAAASDHSFVARQPRDDRERLRALMALVSCPTASIGTVSRLDTTPGAAAFPEPVAEEVSFLGFTSEDSFGAWGYPSSE